MAIPDTYMTMANQPFFDDVIDTHDLYQESLDSLSLSLNLQVDYEFFASMLLLQAYL